MKLRIHRTFTWEIDCPRSEIKFGGTNPYKLVSHDTLQYLNPPEGKWYDVEVVEEEKPKHPNKRNFDLNTDIFNVRFGDK